ncbi:MarR family transcriptional regulator [Gulosibacter molinativorax]|uniref:MarR family transcriptional regulator n=2 Tax=Gulosibacter molinativorax TaxID=256821 RepID=A0ABT7C6U2_9MICO|nr:MarR family transcriptional regulator [Gulosibacter molinativorax]
METTGRLTTLLGSRLQSTSSISVADYEVMLALSEAPEARFRSSELASQMGWERSRLSHHLGRMEKRGLIQRVACADDSRGSEILLTPEGADAFRRCSAPHLRDIRELFVDALTPEQLAGVAKTVDALSAHLDRIESK